MEDNLPICLKSKMGWDNPVEMLIYEQGVKLTQGLKMVGVVELKKHCFHSVRHLFPY